MDGVRQTAVAYIDLLRRTKSAHHLIGARVTKKGGAPAQTAKRLVLGRLTQFGERGLLTKQKGDSYSLRIQGKETNFRFAVTASRGALPWFNITETELETLKERQAILLVVWNPDHPERWCKRLVVFAIPSDELLEGYRQHSAQILQSMLRVAYRKLEVNQHLMPELLNRIRTELDVSLFTSSDVSAEQLRDARQRFVDCLTSHRHEEPGGATAATIVSGKYVASRIRDRLSALLLQIEPGNRLTSFVIRHNKTNSSLLQADEHLITELELGALEEEALRTAYANPREHLAPSQGTSEGIEDEPESAEEELINRPYDPTKSKIDTRVVTIDLLSKRISEDEIDLSPPFQRKAGLWSDKQKSQLIESLLIRIPLPAFYFDATNDARWLVVDGLQRLTVFREFLLKEMRLQGLEYLTSYEDRKFRELPRALQRIIEESQVTVHLIQPGTPPEVKFNIFRRINTGGLALTLQEIRHALNQGPVVALLEELASSTAFVEATTHSISSDRMADRELVLRFLAFSVTDYNQYRIPDMDVFLSIEMARLNKLQSRYAELRESFTRSMNAAKTIFGNQAFRKLYYLHQSRSPINKALFESWSVALGSLSPENLATLVSRKEKVIVDAIALNNTDDFHRAISQGTKDVTKVRKRFESVQKLIAQVLNAPDDQIH